MITLKIPDSATGLVRTIYDCTTGIYSTDQINRELKWDNIDLKSRVDVLCIDKSEAWMNDLEALIKQHVSLDLPIDYRLDGYMRALPLAPTLKELSGIVTVRNGQLKEETYNSQQYITNEGNVYTKMNVSIEDDFQKSDKFVMWHTHPSCTPTGSEDIKAFIETASMFKTLKPQDFYDVRYIPKMDKFYWFNLKKKPLLIRLLSNLNK